MRTLDEVLEKIEIHATWMREFYEKHPSKYEVEFIEGIRPVDRPSRWVLDFREILKAVEALKDLTEIRSLEDIHAMYLDYDREAEEAMKA